ncbi:DNA-binding LacI/PurR family transcriptional regulator [Deinococcus metalli]|uniref:DNA-binding LacI/PurR family transcriptional regulator n=1 Tax=Deinococcus metalli TaxID=1141878 RepID=A0A7W8KHB2_9DEIO|nr:GntR family transcriptional regulator [Deinococcus metalli]MBB5376529.1 DNA-binding LacI/PurR family transcriptional regulator [Deinococcus metalli]
MTTHLYERIVASMLDDLRAGRLRPGDRVPSEHVLAQTFEVSRITSRRALDVLAQASVLERAQGRGTFVVHDLPDLERVGAALGMNPEPASVVAAPANTRSGLVGLVLPDFNDSYGLHLLYAIEQRCAQQGLDLILKRTYGGQGNEERAITTLMRRGVDGLIIFPVHGEHYNPVLLKAVLGDFPVVLIDRYLRGISAPAVVTDNHAAAAALTTYLINQGHRDIAFVSPPVENTSTLEERFEGWSTALAGHGLLRRPELILSNLLSTLPTPSQAHNIAADQSLLEAFVHSVRATAFVCVEYSLALELMATLTRLNRRIPQDVSVACFDAPRAPLPLDGGLPPFTHIQQNETGMGHTAVEMILARLGGQTLASVTHVPFTLIEGRSTAAPGA